MIEPGNEPFIVGDEISIDGQRATVSYSAALEGFFATYYHLSAVYHDDLTTAQFTDNRHKVGTRTPVTNRRTGRTVHLIQYRNIHVNETERNHHGVFC